MGRGIVKLLDNGKAWYLEWSTVVDAPTTWGMDETELILYLMTEYGNPKEPLPQKIMLQEISNRLKRLDEKGTSFHHYENAESLIKDNRAGAHETRFTKEQIIKWYCTKKMDPEELGEDWQEIDAE